MTKEETTGKSETEQAVEAGLRRHFELLERITVLEEKLKTYQVENGVLLGSLEEAKRTLEAERELRRQDAQAHHIALTSVRGERDQAVADRAAYEVLTNGILAQITEFVEPTAPLVRPRSQKKNGPRGRGPASENGERAVFEVVAGK